MNEARKILFALIASVLFFSVLCYFLIYLKFYLPAKTGSLMFYKEDCADYLDFGDAKSEKEHIIPSMCYATDEATSTLCTSDNPYGTWKDFAGALIFRLNISEGDAILIGYYDDYYENMERESQINLMLSSDKSNWSSIGSIALGNRLAWKRQEFMIEADGGSYFWLFNDTPKIISYKPGKRLDFIAACASG